MSILIGGALFGVGVWAFFLMEREIRDPGLPSNVTGAGVASPPTGIAEGALATARSLAPVAEPVAPSRI